MLTIHTYITYIMHNSVDMLIHKQIYFSMHIIALIYLFLWHYKIAIADYSIVLSVSISYSLFNDDITNTSLLFCVEYYPYIVIRI